MTDEFRDLYVALKEAGEAGIRAIEAVAQPIRHSCALARRPCRANAEHEGLRGTVGRLEAEVMALVREVRDLREQRNNGHDTR